MRPPPSSLGRALGQEAGPDDDSQAHFGRKELKLLWPHLRPHIRFGVIASIMLVVSSAASLAAPYLIKVGIDSGVLAKNEHTLSIIVASIVAAGIITWVTLRLATSYGGRFGESALRSIRINVFNHLTHLDMAFFEREKVGRLVARMTSDVETIEVLVTEGLVQMSAMFMYLVGSIAVLIWIDPRLAAVSLLVSMPLMIAGTIIFRGFSERAYRRVRDRIASVLTFMQETVRGVHVVQAFGRERFNSRRFQQVNDDWREANVRSFWPGAIYFPLVEFFGVIGLASVLLFGGHLALHGHTVHHKFIPFVSVGTLAAFVLYQAATLDPIQQLSQLYDTFQQAMSGLAKLSSLLHEQPYIVDTADARALDGGDGGAAFDDVNFHYRDDLPLALADVNINIAPGEVLALVGPTGAGKSSIAKLLLRFYDPTTGSVSLDALDLRNVTLESFRSKTSMVPQEAFLFRGTIRDNIRFGKPDATDEEVEQVCRLMGIEEAIKRLPNGYDTEVRERGAALSGGERQLIALARAVLVDPKLMILDEATSALDAATEAHVEQALRLAAHGRTTIVIAHRLSTAARANRVAVCDHGRIIELGTHDELLARPGGLYAKLYEHWLAN
jgi:ATP-binding cassette subfamily B protein